jgi:hypothetical protein
MQNIEIDKRADHADSKGWSAFLMNPDYTKANRKVR